jgi:enoyl-CoA hydratase
MNTAKTNPQDLMQLSETLSCFSCSVQNNIAHISLNRPEQLNAMNPAFWQELPVLVDAIDASGDIRVLVISSTGKHFSAGMDLSVFANMTKQFKGEPARCAENMRRTVLALQEVFNALEKLRMPVLSAIQGGAIGGAVDMVSATDCRYCTKDAFFTIKETQIGMTADLGTLQRLPHLIPEGIMRELAYTGRNWSAQEALAQGFVNQVFDDQQSMLEGVMKIAQGIAQNSPMAVNGCKEMINYARDHSINESLNYMATWQAGMFQMPDVLEAMAAQTEKRLPNYEPLHPKTTLMGKS